MSQDALHSLPNHVKPWLLAKRHERLEGAVRLKDMPRLLELLADESGEALVVLQFDFQNQFPHCIITGEINVSLKLTCQRCGEPVPYDIKLAPRLAVVKDDDEAAKVIKSFDPLVLSEDSLTLLDVIEEELLLGLPMMASHPQQECKIMN